jgi:Rab3 GTPase-activating protein regulatory subunit N-terminus
MSEDSLLAGTLNCGALLEFVTNAEQCVAATSFGHPDPPNFCLHHEIDLTKQGIGRGHYVMMVAYTKHVVAAQLVTAATEESSSSPAPTSTRRGAGPLHVCAIPTFAPDGIEDQRITCLKIVPLLDTSQKCTNAMMKSRMAHGGTADVTKYDDTDASTRTDVSLITTSEASPVKDNSAGRGDEPANIEVVDAGSESDAGMPSSLLSLNDRVAVVFGTNTNQVFTVELLIQHQTAEAPSLAHVHVMDNDNTLYQVFPIDEEGGYESSPFQFQKRRRKGSVSTNGREGNSKSHVPFQPWGGVTSIEVHQTADDDTESRCYGWLTYGDGTILRVATGAFFPSHWSLAVEQKLSVEDFLKSKRGDSRPLVRCKVKVPANGPGHGGVVIHPLPRYHASPLAFPLPPHLLTQGADINPTSGGRFREEFEAIAFARDGNDLFPAVCFFSSESQNEAVAAPIEEIQTVEKKDSEDGKTAGKSIAQSFVGSAFGALKRTLLFGGRSEVTTETAAADRADYTSFRGDTDGRNDYDLPSTPFPSLSRSPVSLFANGELHDAPRKIESCTVDPDGKLAATCDNLGRVLLIDVATKQTIRMWKGCRDATCYWLHRLVETDKANPTEDQGSDAWRHSSAISKAKLYLVIHARQRRTIEVWRLRQGRRVHAIQVGRIARVIPFSYWSSAASRRLQGCYIIKSISSSDAARSKQLELLTVTDEGSEMLAAAENASVSMSVTSSIRSPLPSNGNVRRAAQRLQHLQQLLSSADAVQFSLDDVRAALHEIESLADLAAALDLLSVGRVLEERLGVVGASFQNDAIAHCRAVLNAALHRGKIRNDMTATNPSVQALAHKLEYHTQVRGDVRFSTNSWLISYLI